jgi:DNA-binding response OmpR family regulator
MAAAHAGSSCVLVIEDDPAIRDMLVWALTDEGYVVVALGDCRRALAYIRANRAPDLILLDYNLPRMCGADFIHALRRDQRARNVPVVIMSASLEAERASRQLDVAAFLPKPFEAERLIALVHQHSTRPSARRRARIYAAIVEHRHGRGAPLIEKQKHRHRVRCYVAQTVGFEPTT